MSQWTQIEELAERASPRPLKVGTDGLLNRYALSADDEIVTYFPDTSKAHGKNGDDFAYLVLACNAAPDMAKENRQLKADNEDMASRLRRIRDVMGLKLAQVLEDGDPDDAIATIYLNMGKARELSALLEDQK